MAAPNYEEAAAIATEFVSNLDNLPSEVTFLLTEIQNIDIRSQELQQEVAKDASRYIRHSGRSTPSAPPNPKDMAIQETIKEHYAQIEQLADEKLVLAQRVIDLISRARAKLDHELSRVLVQQGEDPTAASISAPSSISVPRRGTFQEIKEALRTPRETTPVVTVVPTPSQVVGNKRRRTAGGIATGSAGYSSPAPSTVYSGTGTQRSTRLAASDFSQGPRQSPLPRRQTPSVEAEEDAEGEEDDGNEEDKNLYCFCQKLSYGTMVGCDDDDCQYQWFHVGCVGLKDPPEGGWYCPECTARRGQKVAGGTSRKGRKKNLGH
ncbi:hypothetical protein BJ322DRAFT_1058736 [Thelephora terrestris]|uniref:Chromatin modification-related protein n=1 Tax=Thelephora terrestris TaxID=56493 RepID=A0A9P6L7R0_9AGAM|nr:hypothetical protein BJ322DRAFT_1058736 [Thelephora terrestris]